MALAMSLGSKKLAEIFLHTYKPHRKLSDHHSLSHGISHRQNSALKVLPKLWDGECRTMLGPVRVFPDHLFMVKGCISDGSQHTSS